MDAITSETIRAKRAKFRRKLFNKSKPACAIHAYRRQIAEIEPLLRKYLNVLPVWMRHKWGQAGFRWKVGIIRRLGWEKTMRILYGELPGTFSDRPIMTIREVFSLADMGGVWKEAIRYVRNKTNLSFDYSTPAPLVGKRGAKDGASDKFSECVVFTMSLYTVLHNLIWVSGIGSKKMYFIDKWVSPVKGVK